MVFGTRKEDIDMIIMFAGKAGAGKDTSAGIVRETYPMAENCSFAKKVKELAFQFGWDGEKDEKGRKLLQSVGQTGRAYDKDMWAKDCVKQITEVLSHGNPALVTDLRFRNEMEIVKAAYPDAKIVLVKGRAADLGKNANDVSEHDLDGFNDFDYVLDNSGTEDELRENVKTMLHKFEA